MSAALRSRAAKAVLLAAAAAAGGFFVWQARFSPARVTLAAPETGVEVRVFGVGIVEAQIVSRVGFQTTGRVVEVRADQGDIIAAGEVIGRLDDSAQKARVRKAEVGVLQAETSLAKAQAQAARAQALLAQRRSVNVRRQTLVDRGVVSREAAEDTQASEAMAQADAAIADAEGDVARAAREDAAAQLSYEKTLLDQHVLRAPFRARVIARLKEPGSVAAAGEPVFTLIDPDSVWTRTFVDEAASGALAIGQKAHVRLRSEPDRAFEAEVVRIDQENDRVTEERRVYVRCKPCAGEHQTRYLGEQAQVEIVTAAGLSGVFVPARLIEDAGSGGGHVWTLRDGRLARTRVEVGERLLDGRVRLRSVPAESRVVLRADRSPREGRAAVPADPP